MLIIDLPCYLNWVKHLLDIQGLGSDKAQGNNSDLYFENDDRKKKRLISADRYNSEFRSTFYW